MGNGATQSVTSVLRESMKVEKEDGLTIRERIVLTLTVFIIQMVHPWEYSHQYKQFWEQLQKLMDEKIK